MDNADNYIKHFTSIDIEKYHRGQLSAKEMHALEKAALDDPFLADALEGYAVPGVNAAADIAELKARLEEKESKNKVVAMPARSGRSFFWLRAAAMVVLLAGAAFLTWRFVFDKKENAPELAQSHDKLTKTDSLPSTENSNSAYKITDDSLAQVQKPADSTTGASVSGLTNGENTQGYTGTTTYNYNTAISSDSFNIDIKNGATFKVAPKDQNNINQGFITSEPKAAKSTPPAAIVPGNNSVDQLAKSGETKAKTSSTPERERAYDDFMKADTSRKAGLVMEYERDRDRAKQENVAAANKRAIAQASNNMEKGKGNEYYKNMHTYYGLVMDVNNNVIPFAKVTNTADGVGTYADANGRFNLTSLDTNLNLQIKATGFTNYTASFKKGNSNRNTIVLEEDKSIPEQTLQTQKLNYVRRRSADANMKLEGEPEPEDGWENYDSYLSNNRNIPETMLKEKNASQQIVEVSFEVNREGEPVHFKIEKSLGTRYDNEAIRLIKEGPKWKRKARKGRTTVAISF